MEPGLGVMTQTDVTDPLHYRVTGVGRAFPHVEVKVADPETGEEVPRGTTGELCCRGYNRMKGYYKNPEATAQCIDANGWVHSGDLGVMARKTRILAISPQAWRVSSVPTLDSVSCCN